MLHSNSPLKAFKKVRTLRLGAAGMTAAAFDVFGICDFLRPIIGKEGPNSRVDNPELLRAMCIQLLTVPHQSMAGTEEFFKNRPVGPLIGCEGAECSDLNRVNMSRMLDAVYEAGPERLFVHVAALVARRLGIRPRVFHLDSTSFHYDGKSRSEDGVPVVLDLGYSRDNHPELNQINSLMMVDELSQIPLFQKCVSGHVSDKTSFKETILKDLPMIKEQFKELRYVVGDSAFCTSDIADAAADHGIWFVTRIPDRNGEAAPCIAEASVHPDKLVPVDPEDPSSPKAMWSGEGFIGKQKVVKLTVRNEMLESKKRETVGKHAEKELKALEKKITRLRTRPCKCKADAEKSVKELEESLKLCTISNVQYEEVIGHDRRGHPKDGDKGRVKAVKVTADAAISKELVEEAVKRETYYVICTNDTGRKWTMQELLSTYKRQSVVERSWRCLKDRRVLVSAIWLQLPSRICALMWVMSIALLVYAATEYLMRKAMAENHLSIPWTDQRVRLPRPTLMRMHDFINNSGPDVTVNLALGTAEVGQLPDEAIDVLESMGHEWTTYYLDGTYAGTAMMLRQAGF